MGMDQLIFYSTRKSSRVRPPPPPTLQVALQQSCLNLPCGRWGGGADSELAMVHTFHIGIRKDREYLEWGIAAKSNLK